MGGHKKNKNMGKQKSHNRKKKEEDLEKETTEMVSQPPNSPDVTRDEPDPPSVDVKVQSADEKTEEGPVVVEIAESAVVDEPSTEIVVEEENKEEHVETKQEVTDLEQEQESIDGGTKVEEDQEEADEEDGGKHSIPEENSQKGRIDDEKASNFSEPPEEWTVYEWERKDEDYNVEQAIFVKSYNRKFAATVYLMNPEFRFAADIGPCETFDSEGVKKLVGKMKEVTDIQKITPFDEEVKVTEKELRRFLSEVLNNIKFCLRLACAERGYEYKSGKLNVEPISAVWGHGIDPIAELKTLKAILDEMKEPLMKNAVDRQESRFWSETDVIFEKILPAIESFDSKTLSENSITDCMNSIHGRIELGFKITEEEVDKMLEYSFSEDGFGEFPPTALYASQVFTTANQLKMIFGQLEKMSKVIDIRVKLSGVQMITRIFELINDDEATLVMKELKGQHPVTIEKMFGFDPKKFEINTNDPKRAQYLKIFFTMLAETPKEEFSYPQNRLIAVLKSLYLVFDPFDVNMIIFKIIATRIRDDLIFDEDRRMLIHLLMQLPESLRKRLEVGPAFSTGEVSDDRESMYYQIKHIICTGPKDHLEKLKCFLAFTADYRQESMMCIEKAMRIAIRCIEKGSHQMMAVETLRILEWKIFMKYEISCEFFEELLTLALSKYSVPDAKTSEKKYDFIEMVFQVLDIYAEMGLLKIDEQKIMEKWTNMGHPWFSVLYLSHRFPLLKPSVPVPQYPWLSADDWTDEKKDETDFKNYIPLAKVPTAWPNCIKLKIVEDLVLEHVPVEISRVDLYNAMRKYVSEFTMEERWKESLLRSFDSEISSLTSTAKKEDPSVEKVVSEITVLELKENVNNASKSASAEVMTSEVEVAKEQDSLDLKNVESSEKTAEVEKKEEEAEGVVENGSSAKIDDSTPQDFLPTDDKVEDVETKEEIRELKPLRDAENPFIRYFDQQHWEILGEAVHSEVYRQRKIYGFSNKY